MERLTSILSRPAERGWIPRSGMERREAKWKGFLSLGADEREKAEGTKRGRCWNGGMKWSVCFSSAPRTEEKQERNGGWGF
jgi:hypothetical protein